MAASKIKHMYDALLALRSLTDRATPVTSTAAGGGFVDLHRLLSDNSVTPVAGRPGALGDLIGKFGQTPFDVVIYVDAIDTNSGTETYTLALQSVDANKANPVAVIGGSVTVTSGLVGEPIVLKIDPANLLLSDPAARYLRINATLAGATPSITYYAFAAPNAKA